MSNLLSFDVRNLGPIAEGVVQLHPLTILIGKNNTGKTYMAQAIYTAYKALERANDPVKPVLTTDESEELLNRIHDVEVTGTDALHGSLIRKAEDWMHSRLKRVGEHLGDRLTVYFELEDLSELERWGSNERLSMRVTAEETTTGSTLQFGLGPDVANSVRLPRLAASDFKDSYIPEILQDLMSYLSEEQSSQHQDKTNRRTRSLRSQVTSLLADSLWYEHLLPPLGLNGMAHYLPAGRSGLLEAWTDVVRLRLEQDRERLALTGREPAALGGIALDFLLEQQELIRPSMKRHRWPMMKRHRRSRSGYSKRTSPKAVKAAASHLEKLIDGEVDLARDRERVPSLTYTQRGKRSIPIQQASSIVAELAPLLSWIKKLLRPGDLLLIDEPEAHMHPEAILAVAQTLVALSQSEVKVLCTTHSSEFLHQVSNCMLRAALPLEAPTADDDAAMIKPADIGVYRFERTSQSNGTVIVPVDIDPDWGIPEDEHIAVAERLADETAELIEHVQ